MSYRVAALVVMLAALLMLAAPALAGGWSVITLDSIPSQVIAQEPITVGFFVRQHGVHPIDGLAPTITAIQVDTRESVEVIAEPEGDVGHYVATLVFPSPGIWSWSISAFGPGQSLPPLAVLSLTEYGEALFVAKGCAMCHVHRESGVAPVATINRGPDLSRRSFDAAYLREWLRDPSAVDSDAVMPALGLSDDEISALIAFLNG